MRPEDINKDIFHENIWQRDEKNGEHGAGKNVDEASERNKIEGH